MTHIKVKYIESEYKANWIYSRPGSIFFAKTMLWDWIKV